ncbi:MAG: TolC family protein [Gemmatimonadales bacterium]
MGMEPSAGLSLEGRLTELNIDDFASNSTENMALLSAVGLPLQVRTDFRELMEVALEQRSDLRQQRLNVGLEESRLAVEQANYFPKLSFFTNYNVTAQEDGSPNFFGTANQRTTAAASGIRIELPVFNGFAREARVQQIRASVRSNEVQLDRLERVASNEIQTQLETLEETQLRVATQPGAVRSARRGFEIALAEYSAGVGSQLQVTDAEEALRLAEFNHAQAIFDYLIARARLELAVGLVPDEPGAMMARGDL